MNIIVNGSAIPGGGDTEVTFDFGEVEFDIMTLAELAKVTGTEDQPLRVMVWDLNSDQKHRYKATGIAVVQYYNFITK